MDAVFWSLRHQRALLTTRARAAARLRGLKSRRPHANQMCLPQVDSRKALYRSLRRHVVNYSIISPCCCLPASTDGEAVIPRDTKGRDPICSQLTPGRRGLLHRHNLRRTPPPNAPSSSPRPQSVWRVTATDNNNDCFRLRADWHFRQVVRRTNWPASEYSEISREPPSE